MAARLEGSLGIVLSILLTILGWQFLALYDDIHSLEQKHNTVKIDMEVLNATHVSSGKILREAALLDSRLDVLEEQVHDIEDQETSIINLLSRDYHVPTSTCPYAH